ncbi:hypothetical protein HUU61_11860 [Rhodopseudomonas palustris]|uniref:Uncharacterized protein n=1 Tax=Thiospirillum jenense TaxID=1653858 RepID=A0A839HB92_9GAMM|nr:hypothetical protein [Thiospirillum jenense]MBB1091987.1 hypothetical protein [Rhodopseudomonas palustris]MBB1126295.1 hypothetical protein [Thiospirillum jenense]
MANFFKKAKLAGAVAAAMAAGLAVQTAEAVNLSPDGLGEVALVPYYSARNGYDTYISIVNTDPVNVIAVKIRFREHDNSRDARDFLIYLSPNDVWTGTITMHAAVDATGAPLPPDAAGNPALGWPVIQTNDNSCTVPSLIPFEADASQATRAGMRGVAFTSADYDGTTRTDVGSSSIVRTYDGYVEIIEMGTANPAVSPIAALAVHSNGVPASCPTLEAQYNEAVITSGFQHIQAQFREPLNVMKVAANLINAGSGLVVPMPVTMLANFNNNNSLMLNPPRDTRPDLGDVFPPEIIKINSAGGVQTDEFETGYDSVSALLMATSVINEYAIGGAARALNDWVLTFPTKHFYADGRALSPFSNSYGACETVEYDYANREENSPVGFNVPFSPPLPTPVPQICKEVNILSFAVDGNNIYSALAGNISNASPPPANNVYGIQLEDGFTSGWLNLTFTGNAATDAENGGIVGTDTNDGITETRYLGLPVIGFGIKTYSNTTTGIQYGITQEHAYTRNP